MIGWTSGPRAALEWGPGVVERRAAHPGLELPVAHLLDDLRGVQADDPDADRRVATPEVRDEVRAREEASAAPGAERRHPAAQLADRGHRRARPIGVGEHLLGVRAQLPP